MKRFKRWFFICLIVILNPHRVFLHGVYKISLFFDWLSDGTDDISRVCWNSYNRWSETWPVNGDRFVAHIKDDE